jgi:hypothetical protein
VDLDQAAEFFERLGQRMNCESSEYRQEEERCRSAGDLS